MEIALNILLDVVIALITSYAFWYLTFIRSGTKILFSDQIAFRENDRQDNNDPFIYRIKVINAGYRDLIEVSTIVTIQTRPFLPEKRSSRITRLTLDNEIFPVFKGRKLQRKQNRIASRVLDLYLTEKAYAEFSKEYYITNVREKALVQQLTLTNIIDAYRDTVRITVYIFGNDSVTGARKMFSKEYTASDICYGRFNIVSTKRKGRVATDKTSLVACLKLKPEQRNQ